ncbi:MAG: hypothetical protein HQK92_02905 [Nitrospirae bacterium]|nr:hypothetical protein [Nitrospirota bacterium]
MKHRNDKCFIGGCVRGYKTEIIFNVTLLRFEPVPAEECPHTGGYY